MENAHRLPLARFAARVWTVDVCLYALQSLVPARRSRQRPFGASTRRRLGMADDGLFCGSSAPTCSRRPKKAGDQALGRSRGGPTTKIHLICDAHGNPLEFELTGGQIHDVTPAPELLAKTAQAGQFTLADKGYDSDEFRAKIRERGSEPMVPGRANRKEKIEYDKEIYGARSLVENAFCKLKQYRAVATRYDKLARNFSGMVTMACIMVWLRL